MRETKSAQTCILDRKTKNSRVYVVANSRIRIMFKKKMQMLATTAQVSAYY